MGAAEQSEFLSVIHPQSREEYSARFKLSLGEFIIVHGAVKHLVCQKLREKVKLLFEWNMFNPTGDWVY